MDLKNEIFAFVYEWLRENKHVTDQKDLSQKTGINQNTITRVLNGTNKISVQTLEKLNNAFGGIFNMQYLLGKNMVMLVEDFEYYRNHPGMLEKEFSGHPSDYTIIGHNESQHQSSRIDESSLINAALAAKEGQLAAKDGEIETLNELVRSKNEMIMRLEKEILDKDQVIADLRRTISILQFDQNSDERFKKGVFPIGLAEDGQTKTKV